MPLYTTQITMRQLFEVFSLACPAPPATGDAPISVEAAEASAASRSGLRRASMELAALSLMTCSISVWF
jgi:hypothetical protein